MSQHVVQMSQVVLQKINKKSWHKKKQGWSRVYWCSCTRPVNVSSTRADSGTHIYIYAWRWRYLAYVYKYIRKQRYSGNYPEIQNWNFCEKSEKGLITAWDFSQKFTKKIHTVKFCVVILNLFLLLDYSTSSIAEVFLLQQIFIINIRRKLNSSYRTDTSIFIFIQIFILFVSHNEIQLGFLCFHLFCFKE